MNGGPIGGGGGGRGVREGPRRGEGGGCMHVVCTCRLYPAKRVESITSPLFLISMNHDTQRQREGETDKQRQRGRDRQRQRGRDYDSDRDRQTETERQRQRRQKTHVVPVVLMSSRTVSPCSDAAMSGPC